MATQEHKNPQRRDGEPDGDDAPDVPTAPSSQVQDEDTDSMLDEIDEVLEANAEEFVRGFVQKGGE